MVEKPVSVIIGGIIIVRGMGHLYMCEGPNDETCIEIFEGTSYYHVFFSPGGLWLFQQDILQTQRVCLRFTGLPPVQICLERKPSKPAKNTALMGSKYLGVQTHFY